MTDEALRSADGLTLIAELEEIYRSAPVGLCLLDTDLRYRRINERLAAIHGRSAEEHIGATVEEVVPHLAPKLIPRLRAVLSTGEPTENVEVTGIVPSAPDVPRTWLMSDHPLGERGGAVSGIVSVVRDVSQLTHREEALRAARSRMARAEALSERGCGEWNFLTGETWGSRELRRIFGLGPDAEAAGLEDFVERIVPEDRSLVRARLEDLVGGEDFVETEFRVEAADGGERAIQVRARLTRTGDGHPQVLFGTAQDVTRHHEARRAVAEARISIEREREELERRLEERTRELDRALARLRRRRRREAI